MRLLGLIQLLDLIGPSKTELLLGSLVSLLIVGAIIAAIIFIIVSMVKAIKKKKPQGENLNQ